MKDIRGTSPRKHWMWFPLCVGVSIALFAPRDVLKYEWVQIFVDAMSVVFPSIAFISDNYELQGVLQLYFSTMWLLAPILYFFISDTTRTQEQSLAILQKGNVGIWKLGVAISIFAAMASLIAWVFAFGEHNPFAHGNQAYWISHSRLGLAFYGSLIVFGEVLFVRLIVSWIVLISIMFAPKE